MNASRIKKVKFGSGGVEVNFLDERETPWSFGPTEDQPSPDFLEAMNALARHACEICGLPADYAEECKVSGLTLSYTEDIMGAVITVQKPLEMSNAPFVFNTPNISAEPYGGGLDYSRCLTPKCVEAIEKVTEEAIAYIKGKRAQLELAL